MPRILLTIAKCIIPYAIWIIYYEKKFDYLVKERPHYFYCVWNGALLAKKLGYNKISVIEFGVAGGNGLVLLEKYAEEIGKKFKIDIEVYGFDTGKGLPKLEDYRDMQYNWDEGFFSIDIELLRKKLHKAKLVIGDVKETVKTFFSEYNPAPIAAVMHDMDYYSSTKVAMNIFENEDGFFLPRIFNYFDDINGNNSLFCCSDYTGERLAINEFNQEHTLMKFSAAYNLIARAGIETWYRQIFILHKFNHVKYNDYVDPMDGDQLKLKKKYWKK